MSKGYNFVNKLTKFAQERDEKREKMNTTEYDEDLSFIHEKKQIPLNWDPSEFKDKVSSVWGINLDFFDFPPVSFEEESVSWKKIFRENIFQPFLPKNRIVLEHFVKNIQELQSRTLNTLSNTDEDGNELPSAQPLKRKGSIFKYEYAERAIAQMKNIKKAADKHAQLSNFERRKRMYAVRANANLHKFIYKVSRLRQAEEVEDLISHRMYRIDLSLDSPPIENMLLPEAEGNEEKKVKISNYRRHYFLKQSTTSSREGGHRPSQRASQKVVAMPIKPRRKSCECSICGGINEKEKKAYDLPNFPQSTVSRPNVRNPVVNIENYNLKGLESSNVSQDSPLSPGQSPRGKAERERDSKKVGRRFSWGSVFDPAEKGSRKNSGWHRHQPEPPKKSNYSKFSRMKTDTDDNMNTELDTPQSPFGVKPNKRYVNSMTKLPYSLQKVKNSDDLFTSPKNTMEMKSLPMINFGKTSHAPRAETPEQEISIIKPAKPKKELKLKKKTPKKFRKSMEKNLNNTLSKFMILNAYVQPSSGRKSSTKELKLLSATSANIKNFSTDKVSPTPTGEIKSITSKYKPKALPDVTNSTKKIKSILSPRTSLPSHRIIHKSDAFTDSTNLTSVASPISSRIRLKRIHVDN